jgi:hypothetical protein
VQIKIEMYDWRAYLNKFIDAKAKEKKVYPRDRTRDLDIIYPKPYALGYRTIQLSIFSTYVWWTTLFIVTFFAVFQTRLLPRLFYKASVISTTVTFVVFSNFILFAQMDYIGLRLHNNTTLTYRDKKIQD